ncbi:MAG TPA: PP2C family protein-serine/threonine phosphatase [Humisphaera sp.]|nr:PP2C family protein-serine/threonine phosphatase [Humisphaera sp.]
MRISTKILLLMLLITLGLSASVSSIVTLNVTHYETDRADAQISAAIQSYRSRLNERHDQITRIVQALLEAPAQRSLLQAADDADPPSLEQLKQEVFGRNIQTELQSRDGNPAFHVLLNAASLSNEPLVATAIADPQLDAFLGSKKIHWPVEPILANRPVIQYLATPLGLYLAMGVPLHTQLNDAATHAYFVGFKVDDEFVRQQLLSDRIQSVASGAALDAWFVVDGKVAARASSAATDRQTAQLDQFSPAAVPNCETAPDQNPQVGFQFKMAGERFSGKVTNLSAANATNSALVLASSLDEALIPLKKLQKYILYTVLVACAVGFVLCRLFTRMISKPIEDLVAGTIKIAAGQFDAPVNVRRSDELGKLANSFNEMAAGLKERDILLEERVKIERDLALARKIQMDVLPKELPACPGYDIAAYSLPAEQTGGDIYDLVALALDPSNPDDPQSLVLLLADATGHGIGPALSVTQVRSMIRIGVQLRAELDEVFGQINRQLCHDLGHQRFVTAFLGLLDLSCHNINYRSAGQAPLLHFHGKNHHLEWLDSSMLPLGIDEDPHSEGRKEMQIEPGDMIVLLTDGFYEFQNTKGELFGRDRIGEVILQHHHQPARDVLNEIIEATRRFAGAALQLDDMTAIVISRLPPK